jgi:hypothetical protein
MFYYEMEPPVGLSHEFLVVIVSNGNVRFDRLESINGRPQTIPVKSTLPRGSMPFDIRRLSFLVIIYRVESDGIGARILIIVSWTDTIAGAGIPGTLQFSQGIWYYS